MRIHRAALVVALAGIAAIVPAPRPQALEQAPLPAPGATHKHPIARVLRQEASHLTPSARRSIRQSTVAQARRWRLDPLLVLALMKEESRFVPRAVSQRGARGLLQIMPATARWITPEPLDDQALFDPETNIRLGVQYLSYLLELFGNLPRALQAYNRGPNAIRKDPPRASGHYARRVIMTYHRYRRLAGSRGVELALLSTTPSGDPENL